MTGDWKNDVLTKERFIELVATGMAWEFYPDLPISWEECERLMEEQD